MMLTWNAYEHTKTCLDSLFAETAWPDFEVIVVDNGSTDGTLADLRGRPEITLIENGENLGFVKGCNIGLEALDPAADVIFLNNDVYISDRDWISKLRTTAYSQAEIALVGCRLIDSEGRINHAGAFMRPVEMFGENIGGLEDDIGQYQASREVEAVMAAVLYAKRAVLDEIGAFDEAYFSYYEDTDICFRARDSGYKVWYCGELTLEHAYNTSRSENDYDYWAMYNESGEVFTSKWKRKMLDERSPSVYWRSTLWHPMGYAQMAREQMRALWDLGTYVSYERIYDGADERETGDGLIDNIVRLPRRPGSIDVASAPADLWHKVSSKPRVGYTMLEVDGIPAEWVDAANRMDEIWVPTEFNLETFRDSGVKRPIEVMPLGVDTDHFNTSIRPYREFKEFVFLSIFEWGERKAPDILIKAFNEEFSADDGAVLLLAATNRDAGVNIGDKLRELRLRRGRAPIILWVNPELEGSQLGGLYRSVDAFALTTKGEGWGLPILEAMACGLPVIATNWSAQTAFYDDLVGYPIRVQHMEPAIAKCPYYEGFRWALPDLDHLRELMRHVFENRDEARARGAAAAERAASLSWRASAERIRERLIALSD